MAKLLNKIIILVCLTNSVTNAFSQEKVIIRKSVTGKELKIIPENTRKTILLLGGIDTKNDKLAWYREICKEKISGINLSVIVELFELPFLVPQKIVEDKIKKWCVNLERNDKINCNVFYEWTEEIHNFYQSDVEHVTLVIIDIDKSYTKIEGKYSIEKMKKVIRLLNYK